MKFALSFALLLFGLSPWFGGAAHAQDNAALYFYGPPPTVDDITRVAGDATVTSSLVESVTRVTIAWSDVTVIIHIDGDWRRDEQLASIRQMVTELPSREQHKPAVRKFLADLDRTTVCWGSLIDPGYDREGRVATFFKKLVGASGGFLFTYQSFYSAGGKRIVGLQDDPETLQ
jgi:hypothetical protein